MSAPDGRRRIGDVAFSIAPKNKLVPCAATTITVTLDRPLTIGTLHIDDSSNAASRAVDWVVSDVRIDGVSHLPSGDLPGDAFTSSVPDDFIRFRPGRRVELIVTYIGSEETGCRFSAFVSGTVECGEVEQPPTDLRALVRVGQPERPVYLYRRASVREDPLCEITPTDVADEEVLVRCDWRARERN